MRLPSTRTPPGPGGSTSSPATSGSRTCGRCRRRAARTTSSAGAAGGLGRPVAKRLSRRPHALGDPVEGRGAARLGRPGRRPRLGGADAPRPVAGGSARRPIRPGLRRAPFTSLYLIKDEWAAEIANRTMQGSCTSAGSRTGPAATAARWPSGEAKRSARDRLHGRDRAVPAPDRVPADDARQIERRGFTSATADRRPRTGCWLTDQIASRRERPWAVLYDADCGFCKWLLSGLLRWDRAARLHPIALQRSEADDLLRELTPAERMASWHLISPTGERRSGGAAVRTAPETAACWSAPGGRFRAVPGLTDRGYQWVAEHRSQLSKLVPSSAKQRAANASMSVAGGAGSTRGAGKSCGAIPVVPDVLAEAVGNADERELEDYDEHQVTPLELFSTSSSCSRSPRSRSCSRTTRRGMESCAGCSSSRPSGGRGASTRG